MGIKSRVLVLCCRNIMFMLHDKYAQSHAVGRLFSTGNIRKALYTCIVRICGPCLWRIGLRLCSCRSVEIKGKREGRASGWFSRYGPALVYCLADLLVVFTTVGYVRLYLFEVPFVCCSRHSVMAEYLCNP